MTTQDRLTTNIDGRALILEVHGSVGSLASDEVLGEVDRILTQLKDGAVSDVIVDFGQSEYFGSTMLETLRRIWNELQSHGGRMVLCNVSTVGNEILQIAKFDQLWPIVATKSEAKERLKAS
jgi:anti-anti-sigma factor